MAAYVRAAASAFARFAGTKIGKIVVKVAIYAGISGVTNALASRLSGAKAEDVQAAVDTPLGPRVVHFGETKTGAHRVYDESVNGMRWTVWVVGMGRVSAVLSHRFNDNDHGNFPSQGGGARPSTGLFSQIVARVIQAGQAAYSFIFINPNVFELYPRGQFGGHVLFAFYPGEDDQLADPLMLYVAPDLARSSAPGWTNEHRLRGLQYYVVRSKTPKQDKFQTVYPTGQPTIPALVAMFLEPFDPRINGRRYTDNGALVLAEYLTHPDGYGELTHDDIDWPSFAEAANHCDRLGYRLSGTWVLDQPRGDPLQRMKEGIDAQIWETPEGKFAIRIGAWETPRVHLDDSRVLRINSLSAGPDPTSRAGTIVIRYVDRAADYTDQETLPIGDPADGGEDSLEMSYIPHHDQAAAIGKRMLAKRNPEWEIDFDCDSVGLLLIGERFFTLSHSIAGLDRVPFEVTSWAFDLDTLSTKVSARSVKPSDFALDLSTQVVAPPPVDPTNPVVIGPGGSTPLAILPPVIQSITYQELAGLAVLTIQSDPPNTAQRFEAEALIGGAWLPFTVSEGGMIRVHPLSPGEPVSFRARSWIGAVSSDWMIAPLMIPIDDGGGGGGSPGDIIDRVLV